ncbi:MAG: helix-turn-helix transcriptional regulator [Clostridia bacterium]|nr:helix-turn-helix transcriptional regulator [Clostridia bacterium]
MELSEAVKKRILNLAKLKKITLHRLSLDSGISYSTLNSFMNGKCKTPNLITILHLCEGFGIELNEFFTDTVFEDVEED